MFEEIEIYNRTNEVLRKVNDLLEKEIALQQARIDAKMKSVTEFLKNTKRQSLKTAQDSMKGDFHEC